MYAIHTTVNAVKRTKDVIDMLEHAVQGVHTSENQGRILRFRDNQSGIVGISSGSEVHELDDPLLEREVIVQMPDRRAAKRPT